MRERSGLREAPERKSRYSFHLANLSAEWPTDVWYVLFCCPVSLRGVIRSCLPPGTGELTKRIAAQVDSRNGNGSVLGIDASPQMIHSACASSQRSAELATMIERVKPVTRPQDSRFHSYQPRCSGACRAMAPSMQPHPDRGKKTLPHTLGAQTKRTCTDGSTLIRWRKVVHRVRRDNV